MLPTLLFLWLLLLELKLIVNYYQSHRACICLYYLNGDFFLDMKQIFI